MSSNARSRRLHHVLYALALLLATGPLASCSEHQDLSGPGTGEVVEIELRNFEFSMPEVRVEAGTTVRWRNTTTTFHTVTPDGHSTWSEWQTTSADDTFEVVFNQAGSYPYFCQPHRSLGMTGTIIVE